MSLMDDSGYSMHGLAARASVRAGFCACIFFLCLLLAPLVSRADDVHSLSVQDKDGSYIVDLRIDIHAESGALYKVLTDYARLGRINPAISYTRLLATPEDAPPRVKSKIHMCISFYCRNLIQVQKMYALPPDYVRAVIVPGKSDFKAGAAYWRLKSNGNGTALLHFHANMTPDFWVPPLIGPWLIKRVLRSEAVRTARALERVARSGDY